MRIKVRAAALTFFCRPKWRFIGAQKWGSEAAPLLRPNAVFRAKALSIMRLNPACGGVDYDDGNVREPSGNCNVTALLLGALG